MLVRSSRVAMALSVVAFSVSSTVFAQQPRTLTTDDYAHSERWMNYNVLGLVHHTIGGVQFLPDGRVFYRDPGPDGVAYMIADPAKRTQVAAFDTVELAKALDKASQAKQKTDPKHLAVSNYVADSS